MGHTNWKFNRVFLRPRESAEAYFALSQGGRQRREYRRQRRRLADLGTLDSRVLTADEPVGPWLTECFRLDRPDRARPGPEAKR